MANATKTQMQPFFAYCLAILAIVIDSVAVNRWGMKVLSLSSFENFDLPEIDTYETAINDAERVKYYDGQAKKYQTLAKQHASKVTFFETFGSGLGTKYAELVAPTIRLVTDSGYSIEMPAIDGFTRNAATIPAKLISTRKNNETGKYDFFTNKVEKNSAKVTGFEFSDGQIDAVASLQFEIADCSKLLKSTANALRRGASAIALQDIETFNLNGALLTARIGLSAQDYVEICQATVYADAASEYKQLSKALKVDEKGITKTIPEMNGQTALAPKEKNDFEATDLVQKRQIKKAEKKREAVIGENANVLASDLVPKEKNVSASDLVKS